MFELQCGNSRPHSDGLFLVEPYTAHGNLLQLLFRPVGLHDSVARVRVRSKQ